MHSFTGMSRHDHPHSIVFTPDITGNRGGPKLAHYPRFLSGVIVENEVLESTRESFK